MEASFKYICTMKKLILSFLLINILLNTTCKKEEKQSNPIIGTTWVHSYSNYLTDYNYIVIKFISATEVVGYFADINLIMSENPTSATYSIKNNSIVFTNFIVDYSYPAVYWFKTAEIIGETMKVSEQYRLGTNEWWSIDIRNFQKQAK